MTTGILLALAAILIGTRLPPFYRRQQLSKNERIVLTLFVFSLLGLAVLVTGGANFLVSIFRSM